MCRHKKSQDRWISRLASLSATLVLTANSQAYAELNAAAVDRIEIGMSRVRVEEILQRPIKQGCDSIDTANFYIDLCLTQKDRVFSIFTKMDLASDADPVAVLSEAVLKAELKFGRPYQRWDSISREHVVNWHLPERSDLRISVQDGDRQLGERDYLTQARYSIKIRNDDDGDMGFTTR